MKVLSVFTMLLAMTVSSLVAAGTSTYQICFDDDGDGWQCTGGEYIGTCPLDTGIDECKKYRNDDPVYCDDEEGVYSKLRVTQSYYQWSVTASANGSSFHSCDDYNHWNSGGYDWYDCLDEWVNDYDIDGVNVTKWVYEYYNGGDTYMRKIYCDDYAPIK